ncbi:MULTISPECIES: bacteriohemerythrin [unclassified Campylobacter]|uniref:bacteriohemerythrin n=1 Tax=unclassified Campylobacter TaxID=2593542 RepID=UPI001237CFC7|nr:MULTISPECIES: hemerythrin family protein [unclassified Campylobacter]KAA6225040.1 bacteriohemerythrin [Campylobacter sp. LR185c]KAA6225999.1 bacteriohemerythrin [Campylobacter sp. LR196d]KAA6226056.1 bacteriohemerythrin [Campylobacter sp. LR286c]KAA6230369.1 bacteriohemerythrin [Campylobacter sp. LR264d]KAA8603361.1 hemerythrin family non-heme iron protein [Campylobacter sp. LR185c]
MEKLVPPWEDKYSINDSKIDAEHKKLFEIASKVESAVYKYVERSELKEILSELFSYMKVHFHNEEEYMQDIGYPYLNEHKIMHKDIVSDMSNLIQNVKTTNDLKEKLYTVISDWLLDHILHHDMMIGSWLNEQNFLKEEEDFAKLQEEYLNSGGQEVVVPPMPKEVVLKQPRFIYSCPCKAQHILVYQDHLDISCHKKTLKCKKCQKDLFYVKTEIVTEKRTSDVSKMG